MFEREPGPFAGERLSAMASAPDRRSFVGLVADALGDASALDAGLGATTASLPDDGAAHVDGAFQAAMSGAGDGVSTAAAQFASSPAGQLIGAGQVVPYRAGQSAPFLPDADTQPSAALIEPPGNPDYSEPPSHGGGPLIPQA
jgi:hypothetical protein